MTSIESDAAAGTVSFRASRGFYSRQSLEIAALVFETQARVFLAEDGKSFAVELRSKKKKTSAGELEALAGEFLNELLNQEYRLLVGSFNAKISHFIVTQALYCAGGGERKPGSGAGESAREYRAEVDRLMRDARAEIKAARPKRGGE